MMQICNKDVHLVTVNDLAPCNLVLKPIFVTYRLDAVIDRVTCNRMLLTRVDCLQTDQTHQKVRLNVNCTTEIILIDCAHDCNPFSKSWVKISLLVVLYLTGSGMYRYF